MILPIIAEVIVNIGDIYIKQYHYRKLAVRSRYWIEPRRY